MTGSSQWRFECPCVGLWSAAQSVHAPWLPSTPAVLSNLDQKRIDALTGACWRVPAAMGFGGILLAMRCLAMVDASHAAIFPDALMAVRSVWMAWADVAIHPFSPCINELPIRKRASVYGVPCPSRRWTLPRPMPIPAFGTSAPRALPRREHTTDLSMPVNHAFWRISEVLAQTPRTR